MAERLNTDPEPGAAPGPEAAAVPGAAVPGAAVSGVAGPVVAGHGVAGPGVAGPGVAGKPEAGRLGAAAIGLITAGIAAFAVVMALGPSAAVPGIGAGGPPFWLHASPSAGTVTGLERLAALAGAAGTITGLIAARRGWRPSARLLTATGIVAAALFVLLPPAGSTDVLNYAVYGRIAVLGHNPYLMTPAALRRIGDPVALLAPAAWRTLPTVYGPVATAVQWVAAALGGSSMARIVFFIRLGNALAFVGVAAALLRLAGPEPGHRIRIGLLWTANPLMLFWLIGSGHLDVSIALLTVAALIAVRQPGVPGGLVAGALVGAAIGIKLTYVVVAAGLGWRLRGSPRTLVAGVAAAVLLCATYLMPGAASQGALSRRLSTGARFVFYLPHWLAARPQILAACVLLATGAAVTVLARRLPPDDPRVPGIRLLLALALGSLVVLPVQTPWYDALIFVLLALMPASGLDCLLVVRCLLLTELVLPGAGSDSGWVSMLAGQLSHAGLIAVIALLLVWPLRGRRPGRRPRDQPVMG